MEQAYKSERERLYSTDFGERNTSYRIVKINSFEEASEYGKYTPWCVTHDDEAFDNYTNNGICIFYFCLKDGFESIPEKIGENCPLDEYGLSMLAVCVDENGECNSITCRWNDNNGGNGNIMSTEELSRLLGVNFYEVFKPSTLFKEKLEKALSLAEKGDFSGFDNIDNFDKNGLAKVELNNKWNFIDTNGNLLSKQWFDYISYFENGFAKVMLNNKYNFIDVNCNLLSKQWFYIVYDFNEYDISKVKLNNKWNFIDTNGNLLSQQWFDNVYNFNEYGISIVVLNKKCNLIDTNGNLLSQQWFDNIFSFNKNGIAQVELNRKWNLIDKNGKLLSKQWFDSYDDAYYFMRELLK